MKSKFLVAAMSAALLLGSTEAKVAHASQTASAPRASHSQAKPPATNWKQIPIPNLPPFKPKEPTRIVLPNGMVIFSPATTWMTGLRRVPPRWRPEPAVRPP